MTKLELDDVGMGRWRPARQYDNVGMGGQMDFPAWIVQTQKEREEHDGYDDDDGPTQPDDVLCVKAVWSHERKLSMEECQVLGSVDKSFKNGMSLSSPHLIASLHRAMPEAEEYWMWSEGADMLNIPLHEMHRVLGTHLVWV